MRRIVMICVAVALVLRLVGICTGQTVFEEKLLQDVQSSVETKTNWQSTRITPIQGTGQHLVITQWTSKDERGVVLVKLYQLESPQAAHNTLKGLGYTFEGTPMTDIGHEAHSWRHGGVAFRRGSIIVQVNAVAFEATDRHKPNRVQERALCERFARAVDLALKSARNDNN